MINFDNVVEKLEGIKIGNFSGGSIVASVTMNDNSEVRVLTPEFPAISSSFPNVKRSVLKCLINNNSKVINERLISPMCDYFARKIGVAKECVFCNIVYLFRSRFNLSVVDKYNNVLETEINPSSSDDLCQIRKYMGIDSKVKMILRINRLIKLPVNDYDEHLFLKQTKYAYKIELECVNMVILNGKVYHTKNDQSSLETNRKIQKYKIEKNYNDKDNLIII